VVLKCFQVELLLLEIIENSNLCDKQFWKVYVSSSHYRTWYGKKLNLDSPTENYHEQNYW
jgi:hypothetical protein